MLCTACQRIFRGQLNINKFGLSEEKIHHPDPQSLIRSATQNCYICNALYMRQISELNLLEHVWYTTYE